MSHYLVLPRIDISDANAQPAWWIIGPPPPTAYWGFAYALGMSIDAKPESIAIVHHHIEYQGEYFYRQFHPQQYRSATYIDHDDYSSRNPHQLSGQPTARCRLTLSIVLRVSDEDASGIDLAHVADFLRTARIAGGAIDGFRRPQINDRMGEVRGVVRTGFCLHDRQDLMVGSERDTDNLDTLLRVTRDAQDTRNEDDASLGWLMPTTLGYRAVTTFEQRDGVRQGLDHAYAEPLVGLVQYRSLRKHGWAFWKHAHDPQHQTFVLTQA